MLSAEAEGKHEILIIHDIMRKPNSIIVLLYIFHIIHPQKYLKGYIDFNVLSYVNFKTPKYNIRNSEATLVKGLFKTDVFKFSFFNRIVDPWNCLPLGMRTIEHFSLFKSSINKFYLNKFNVNEDRFL